MFPCFHRHATADDVSKQRALHKIYNGATSSTATLTPQKLVSLLIDWFITSMCLRLLLDLRECRDGNDGTAAAAGSHSGWKWKRRTTAAALNYRYIGVLLLATLIPHIFNASTLLFSPSPIYCLSSIPLHTLHLHLHTSTIRLTTFTQ